jgi:hypothetical protein
MTYSQLLFRLASAAIVIAAGYLLATGRLCFLSGAGDCRPVHGLAAIALFLAAVSLAAFLFIASTQPRRGARARNLIVACIVFLLFYMGAFVLDLVAPG